MPCLEISMPHIDLDMRRKLAQRLTDTFVEVADFDREIFGIRFNEYDLNQAALGGRLCDGAESRPYLHMLLYCPRLRRSVKQQLVERFTQMFVECTGHEDWKPVIHLCEHPYDNVGVNGQLLSDAYEECRTSRFYYDLPQD